MSDSTKTKKERGEGVSSAFGALDGITASAASKPTLKATASTEGAGSHHPHWVTNVMSDVMSAEEGGGKGAMSASDGAAFDEVPVGRWPEAAIHTVTVVLGAGVLSLPYAVAQVGLAWGVVLLVVACIASFYSAHILAHLTDNDFSKTGTATQTELEVGSSVPTRIKTYRALGVSTFGKALGTWLTLPFQWMVLVGVSIIFFGLGGQSLAGAIEFATAQAGGPSTLMPLWAWRLLFTALCMIAAPMGGIHEALWISALSGSVSIIYSTMGVAVSCIDLATNGIASRPCDNAPRETHASTIFHAFNAIGLVVFAFGGHSLMPEIQATLAPEPKSNNSARPMMKGVIAAYVPTSTLYFALSITGYLAYGECVHTNVLLSSSSKSSAAIASFADLLVAIHVFGAIQLYLQPPIHLVRNAVLHWMHSATSNPSSTLRNDRFWRFVIGPLFMLALGAFSAAVPDAAGLIGIVGGVGITWMTFALPSVMFVKTTYRSGGMSTATIALNAVLAVVCTCLGLLATVGAIYTTFFGS